MKKNTVLYVLLAAAGVYLLTSARPRRGYSITVPEPEKLSEREYYEQLAKSRAAADKAAQRQRALDTARKAVELARKLAERKQKTKSIGILY